MAWFNRSMCMCIVYILLPFRSSIACSNFDENGVDVYCSISFPLFKMEHVISNVLFPALPPKIRYKYPQLRFPYKFTQKCGKKCTHEKTHAYFRKFLPSFTAGQKPHATMHAEREKNSNLSTIIHSIFNGTIYFLRSSKKD